MLIPARVNDLNPEQRVEFECKALLRWRITWNDGTSEVVEGHSIRYNHEYGVVYFMYYYIGAHRYVNLQHVRDIEELPTPNE